MARSLTRALSIAAAVPHYRADGAPVFPVPEPAIWALVALGLVLIWLGRARPKS